MDIDSSGLADTAAAVRETGSPAEVIRADVTDLAAVSAAVARTAEVFGRLDAAHNNAGVPGPYMPLDEYSEADFLRVLQVDLVGVWRCMRAEIRLMRAQRAGAIVNTSSMLGAAAMPDNGAYVAAKHGVTRAAALEPGGTGGDRRGRGLAVLTRSLLRHRLGAGRRRRLAGRMTAPPGRSRR